MVISRAVAEHQIKSAYIFRFVNYIQWPDEQGLKQYHIGFIGTDKRFLNELTKAAKQIKVKGRGFKVQHIKDDVFEPVSFQIIVVDSTEAPNVPIIANRLRRSGTLLVTDQSKAKRDFMINLNRRSDGTIGFEVNRTNLVFEYLKLDKEILLLGGSELDVAELFRESEYLLQQQKIALIDKEKNLQALEQDMVKNSLALKSQQQKINAQASLLSQQQTDLHSQAKQIQSKAATLALTTNELEQASVKLKAGQQQLDHQLAQLGEKEQEVKGLSTLISQNKKLLEQQLNQLERQQQNLKEKGSRIDAQKETIKQQQDWLVASIIVLLIFVLLIVVILGVNRARRRANQNLENAHANIAILSDMGKQISASLDVEKIQDTLYQYINQLMDAGSFGIGIYKPDEQLIDYKMAIENGVRFKPFTRDMNDDNQLPVWCIKHKKEILINDVNLEYKRYLNEYKAVESFTVLDDGSTPFAPISFIYIPILLKGTVLGVFTVQSARSHAYNDHHVDMLRTLATYTASALDNAMAYRALRDTQAQLVMQEKMASLGTLTAGVAHEINNPTNFVHVSAENLVVDLGHFQQFLLDLAGEDASETLVDTLKQQFTPLLGHLTTITNGTERIKTIVQDLRDFTQMDCAEQKTVNIVELLQSTVNLVQTQYLEVAKFVTDFKANPELHCYPARLNQVFMNLIVNACDAIGEKQLREPGTKGQIIIGCQLLEEADEKTVEITIKDNGDGMSDETKNKLFEPFYTTKEVGAGTGLGLSISYGIVQQHGGELSVVSQLGLGSEFRLCLPV